MCETATPPGRASSTGLVVCDAIVVVDADYARKTVVPLPSPTHQKAQPGKWKGIADVAADDGTVWVVGVGTIDVPVTTSVVPIPQPGADEKLDCDDVADAGFQTVAVWKSTQEELDVNGFAIAAAVGDDVDTHQSLDSRAAAAAADNPSTAEKDQLPFPHCCSGSPYCSANCCV